MKQILFLLRIVLNARLIKFALTGGLGFLIDMYLTWLLKEKFFIDQYAAHALGFLFAVLNNYLINKYWTFKGSDDKNWTQFLLFLLISFIGLGINTLFLYVFVKFLKLNFYLAKVLSVLFIFVWNYTSNSVLTFGKRRSRLAESQS